MRLTVDDPFVTVIMPVRNERSFIDRSLGSVLDQTWPSDRMEVIVVDGSSDDGTPAAVGALVAERQARARAGGAPFPTVTVLDNPQRIVPVSMNIGIRKARGDVVLRVDG